jgi:GAF domain-containing protein
MEAKYIRDDNKQGWMQIFAMPRADGSGEKVLVDGIFIDTTKEKELEIELASNNENLEQRRQDMLQTLKRQSVMIDFMNIMQITPDISQAIDESFAIIGRQYNISRVYIIQLNEERTHLNCTYEWCNESVSSAMDFLQNLSLETSSSWINAFSKDGVLNCPNIYKFFEDDNEMIELLEMQEIKSTLCIAFDSNPNTHGFVGIDSCEDYIEFDIEYINLLKNISLVVSAHIDRHAAQDGLILLNKRQEALIKISHTLRQTSSLHEGLENSLQILADCVETCRITIFQMNEDRTRTVCTHEWCAKGVKPAISILSNISADLTEQWFQYYEKEGQILEIQTISMAEDDPESFKIFNELGVKSQICALLVQDNRRYGFIEFHECKHDKKWNKEDFNMLSAFAQIITAEFQRAEAQEKERNLLETISEKLKQEVQKQTIELAESNNSLLAMNEQLQMHQTQLSNIVEMRTSELRQSKDSLISLSHRQNALISILQIMQSGKKFKAMISRSLEEIGICLDLSAVKIYERKAANMIVCDYYWQSDAKKQSNNLNIFANLRDNQADKLFNAIRESGHYAVSEISELDSNLFSLFNAQGIKSFVSQPLKMGCRDDSLLIFEETTYEKKWKRGDSELINTFSQILFTAAKRHQIEDDLVIAKEQAEESNNLKTAFLTNMSHEIKTPLHGITTMIEVFVAEAKLCDFHELDDCINHINTNSIWLQQIISDILDIAKIESKQLEISTGLANINDILSDIYQTFTNRLNNKPFLMLEYIKNVGESEVLVTDKVRLKQILNNILDNAFKFTEKGIILYTYSWIDADTVEFLIEDTGIGISDENKELIFDRFRQIDIGDNRIYGGTGIGLSISRSLAQMLGGDIRVESKLGEGSKFYITIKNMADKNA